MAHSEKRTVWWKEGLFGLAGGALYGLTSVAVGHPFDTVKTKMQAQKGFETVRMVKTFARVLQHDGAIGLYSGSLAPLIGSGIFRSVQFGSYEAVYTYMQNEFGMSILPCTGGVQLRVLFGGVSSGICRAVVETPLDFWKTTKQLGQKWKMSEFYTGFGITTARNVALMTTFFVIVDSGNRHLPEYFRGSPHIVAFMKGGIAASLAWFIVWPLDLMKSQVQGKYRTGVSVISMLQQVVNEKGFLGLYRGAVPGIIRSFMANGCSFIVWNFAQKKFTEWGFRS